MIEYINKIKNAKEHNEERKRNYKASHPCIAAIRTVLGDGAAMTFIELMDFTGQKACAISYATREMVAAGVLSRTKGYRKAVFTLIKE
jgi:hypothetical protein